MNFKHDGYCLYGENDKTGEPFPCLCGAADAPPFSKNPARYDEAAGTLTICGVKYSISLFETLAYGPIGGTFRIIGRADGVVTLQAIYSPDAPLPAVSIPYPGPEAEKMLAAAMGMNPPPECMECADEGADWPCPSCSRIRQSSDANARQR